MLRGLGPLTVRDPVPPAWRRLAVTLFLCATAGAVLLAATATYAAGGAAVKLVSVSKTVAPGSQASAWFRVARGSTCRLHAAGNPHAGNTRGRAVRARRSLLQYDWKVGARTGSGSWTVTLACVHGDAHDSASTTIRVRHGRQRGGAPLFARRLRPTQAALTTAADGLGSGSWKPFGAVLVSGKSWLDGKGVDVKSNGTVGCYSACRITTPYGIAYQCVELIQRLIVSRGWSPRIYGNARDQYANASTRYFDKHPNGSGYKPMPGDIIVYRGGWEGLGHVSVVEWVSGGRIGWVEQNASTTGRGSAPLGSDGRLGNQGSLIPIGFLHAKANKPPPAVKPPKVEPPESKPPSGSPGPSGPSPDKSAPSTPTSLKVSSPTTSSLTLSWSKSSDNVGVVGYSLYRSGASVTKTSSTSYKFTGLSCGTSYKLGVDAYDAAGNRSAAASVTTSTASCPKSVTVSKGAHVSVSGCSSSACAYVTVKLSNFGSGSHTVTCYADYPPPTGSYYQYTTSSTTSNVCVYGYAGTHVWVKVDGVESNHLTW
jgi:chitodextrinase